jgi:hypothetical protein
MCLQSGDPKQAPVSELAAGDIDHLPLMRPAARYRVQTRRLPRNESGLQSRGGLCTGHPLVKLRKLLSSKPFPLHGVKPCHG